MADLQSARQALDAGKLDLARQLFMQSYDQAPGAAAFGLSRVALEQGDYQVAENLARTARENGAMEALVLLADAVGRQGRRKEAERLALDAMSAMADSGVLRAVLGEQRIRQGEWDLGTQDFIDALTLDGRGEVVAYLHRVTTDMTRGHAAGKIDTKKAMAFINRVEYSAPGNDDHLVQLFAAARRAINSRSVLNLAPPRVSAVPPSPAQHAAPSSRAVSPPATRGESRLSPGGTAPPSRVTPALVAVMQRDRKLNEQLQAEIESLGLPVWPTENRMPLDDVPRMQPTLLQIDPEEFRREHISVTTGSIASEIIIERALQSLMRAVQRLSATPPTFDAVGLTQLELAFWDDVHLDQRGIPDVYYGEEQKADLRLLGLGGFLGECLVRYSDLTWSFERPAIESKIPVGGSVLEPFTLARRWLESEDSDDVHLERLLGEARALGELQISSLPRHDPTQGLRDVALKMKLAERWLQFRMHPLDTPQNEVAAAIRPLNVFDEMIFFAIRQEFAPGGAGSGYGEARFKDELAMAYVRDTGEFLCLGSRKHFARAAGIYIGKLDKKSAQRVLDMFSAFHRPDETVERHGERGAKLERREGAMYLSFETKTRSGQKRSYSLVHRPNGAVEWQLQKR